MDTRLLIAVKRVGDAANRAVLAHLNRADSYVGLTLNERAALTELAATVAALEREEAFPLSGMAVLVFYSLAEWLCWRSASLTTGTRRKLGYLARSASIIVRELGTRTPATATTADSSSSWAPGEAWAARSARTWLLLASSYSERGLSIDATATPGVSGAPQGRAV